MRFVRESISLINSFIHSFITLTPNLAGGKFYPYDTPGNVSGVILFHYGRNSLYCTRKFFSPFFVFILSSCIYAINHCVIMRFHKHT